MTMSHRSLSMAINYIRYTRCEVHRVVFYTEHMLFIGLYASIIIIGTSDKGATGKFDGWNAIMEVFHLPICHPDILFIIHRWIDKMKISTPVNTHLSWFELKTNALSDVLLLKDALCCGQYNKMPGHSSLLFDWHSQNGQSFHSNLIGHIIFKGIRIRYWICIRFYFSFFSLMLVFHKHILHWSYAKVCKRLEFWIE